MNHLILIVNQLFSFILKNINLKYNIETNKSFPKPWTVKAIFGRYSFAGLKGQHRH
jgi:hypothetical protein